MEANLICIDCKHFDGKNFKCKAFPKGLPDVIISGESAHEKPLPNQKNEVVYEKES